MKLTRRRRRILKQKAIGLVTVMVAILLGSTFPEIGTIAVVVGCAGIFLICVRKTMEEITKEGISEEVKQLKRENEGL